MALNKIFEWKDNRDMIWQTVSYFETNIIDYINKVYVNPKEEIDRFVLIIRGITRLIYYYYYYC